MPVLFRIQFIIGISIASMISSCGPNMIENRDDQGALISKYQMRDGVKHGQFIGYHPDGSIFEESTYINGQVHGIRTLFYEGNKKIKTLETYENGTMEGLFEEYHLNGKVSFTGLFVNGAMEGIWKKYSESGQLIEEVTFEDSEENGPFKEYHPNGQLAATGGYLGGDNEHGPLQIYNEQGELIKKMDCTRGICQTTWTIETSK